VNYRKETRHSKCKKETAQKKIYIYIHNISRKRITTIQYYIQEKIWKQSAIEND